MHNKRENRPLPSNDMVQMALALCTTVEARESFYNTMQELLDNSDLKERSRPIISSQKEVNTFSEAALDKSADAWSKPKKFFAYAYFKLELESASSTNSDDRKNRLNEAQTRIESICKSSGIELNEEVSKLMLEDSKSFHKLQESFVNWVEQARKAPEEVDIEELVNQQSEQRHFGASD